MYLPLLLCSSLVTGSSDVSEAAAPETVGPPVQPQEEAAEQEAETPKAPWKGAFNLGFTFSEGNTEVRSLNIGFNATRETEKDIWRTRAWWNVQEDRGTTTQNDAGGTLDYNYLVNERFYWLGTSGLQHDDQAKLALRWYAGAGAGYRFKLAEPTLFSADLAVTYLDESFQDDTGNEYIAARVSYNLAHQVTANSRLTQVAEVFPSVEDGDNIYARVDTIYRIDISNKLFSQFQYVFDWDNTPASGAERTDHRIVVGIGWTFGE